MIKRFRLEGLEKRYPRELSGGQQQEKLLVYGLCSPDVILLDEPFRCNGYISKRTITY